LNFDYPLLFDFFHTALKKIPTPLEEPTVPTGTSLPRMDMTISSNLMPSVLSFFVPLRKASSSSSVPKHCLQRPFELRHERHLLGAAKESAMPRFAGSDMGGTRPPTSAYIATNGLCLGSSGGRGHEGSWRPGADDRQLIVRVQQHASGSKKQ